MKDLKKTAVSSQPHVLIGDIVAARAFAEHQKLRNTQWCNPQTIEQLEAEVGKAKQPVVVVRVSGWSDKLYERACQLANGQRL